MWVLPKAASSHPWPLWSTIKETNWFLLTRNNVGLVVDKPYQIILKTGKNEGWLVAVGKEDEALKAWKFIEENIAVALTGALSKADLIEYALGKFRSLALDQELQMLPPEAQSRVTPQKKLVNVNMDADEFDERFYLESGDVTAAERDLEDLVCSGLYFSSRHLSSLNRVTPKTKLPKKLDIPESETILALFTCSLWSGTIPRTGELYLTPNFLGFYAEPYLMLPSHSISIRLTDIVHVRFFVQLGNECTEMFIKKPDGSKSSATSSTSTPSNPTGSLSGFITIAFATSSDGIQIFEEVNNLWKLALKKFQTSESDKKRVREGDKKEEYLVTYEEAMKSKKDSSAITNSPPALGHTLSSTDRAAPRSVSPNTKKTDHVMKARQGLSKLRPKVLKKFRLPESEQLLTLSRAWLTVYAKRGSSFIKSSNDIVAVEGYFYLTTHFLVFLDYSLYQQSPLFQPAAEASGAKSASPFQTSPVATPSDSDVSDVSLNDDAQSANVLLAEWDVAAAEDEQSSSNDVNAEQQRIRQQQLIRAAKKKVPATSLATAEDAPTRVWIVIPLREVLSMKAGKTPATTSTAYSEFGIVPYTVNVHLSHNMYSFTTVNRSHLLDCMTKVHTRVLHQESLRIPLPIFSRHLESPLPSKLSPRPSSADIPISLSPTISIINTSGSPPQANDKYLISASPPSPMSPSRSSPTQPEVQVEPPPRHLYFRHVTTHPLASGEEKFPDSILNDAEQFASTYRARERLQEEKFLSYFHKYGQGISMVRKGPELPILVRNGIPQSLRGHMWFTLSGAANKMMVAPKGYYQSILDTYGGKHSTAVEQIERDLHRSMPSHPFYSVAHARKRDAPSVTSSPDTAAAVEEEYKPCTGNAFYHPYNHPSNEPQGISRLRRVLVAYSWHNPVIAYCQSMNIVVATLLLYLSEEEAFYTLITLVEYLEEYWTREMMGAIVDMLVLKDLLKQKKSALVAHLEAQQLDYSIVALPWFMCLFIGYVPLQLALRLMDCFFYNAGQGKATATLFQAALALFTIAEEELMTASDPVAVSAVLRRAPYGYDCDKLISLVFSDDALALRTSIIEELRNYHRYNAIQNIEAQNMEEEFKILVFGKRLPYSIKSATDSPAVSTEVPMGPPPPPTTAVHFDLSDLKRRYIDFKDAVLSAPNQSSQSQNSDSLSESQDLTRMMNSKSIQSSMGQTAFENLFKRHLGWWPSAGAGYLLPFFKWMDQAKTNSLTFVEYIQGLDVLVFGNSEIIVPLIYELTKTNPAAQGLDSAQFRLAARIIYYILLYSKADIPVPTEDVSLATPSPAPVPIIKRRVLNLQSVSASEKIDDWHLIDADEKFDELVSKEKLDVIFNSYAEDGIISKERFLISISNQLKLMPPALINDM